jgi:hypothetical protein
LGAWDAWGAWGKRGDNRCGEEDRVCRTLFPEATWLTLTYLRAMRVQMMWNELDESGVLDNVQPVAPSHTHRTHICHIYAHI